MSKFNPGLDELVFFENDDTIESPITSTINNKDVDPTDDGITGDDTEDDTLDDSSSSGDSSTVTTDVDSDVDDSDNDSEDDDNGSNSDLSTYFNFLKDNQLLILPEDFEFDGTEEGFEKAVEESRNNMMTYGAQMIWEKLPKDFQLVLEYGLSGGKDLNKVKEVVNSQADLDNLNLEDEETQEDIIAEHLRKTTKYDDEKIYKTIKRLKALGELGYEAESSLKELKEIYKEEREAIKLEAQKKEQEYRESIKESYNMFNDTLSKMSEISDIRKDKILRSIWAANKYEGYGEMSYFNYVDTLVKNNPEHLIQLAELYLDYDPKKGFNSESITRKVKTQVTKGFRDTLEEITKTKLPTKGSIPKKKEKVTTQDVLEQFLAQRRT